jgi:hypothetical protein
MWRGANVERGQCAFKTRLADARGIRDLQRPPNAIIVGQALAEKAAVKTGDTVNLIGGQPRE